MLHKDALGNAHVGDVLICNSSNTLVHATSCLVTLVGEKEFVLVETSDAVLVANKHSTQDLKDIVMQ